MTKHNRNDEKTEKSEKETISEELYNRIPEKFKPENDLKNDDKDDDDEEVLTEISKNHAHFRSGPEKEERLKSPLRGIPAFQPILLIFLTVALLYFIYSSTKTTKKIEISWSGFNALLEQKVGDKPRIDSLYQQGGELFGVLGAPPEIDELPQLLPQGEQLPAILLKQTVPSMKEESRNEILSASRMSENWVAKPVRGAEKSTGKKEYELVFAPKNSSPKRTGMIISNRFRCEIPPLAYSDPGIDQQIRTHVGTWSSTPPVDNSAWINSWFMVILISISIFFFIMVFRMMRRTNDQLTGGNSFGQFNRSPARRYDPDGQPITFKDVAGLENVKKELEEIVDFLKNPEKYEKMGATVPKGTLLFGPPGTGKTLLGRAVAGEAGVPFFSINGSEFIQMFVGVGASRVRDLFNQAKEAAPAILFIDEIDAVGRQRGTGVGGGQDEREQTLNQILSEMDGFTPTESVMVMAATNRPDVLDPALMRPGRFDRHITVDRPSLKGRKEIFEVYIKKIRKGNDIDIDKLARSTVGFTGADIRNLVNEAALWATRHNKSLVEQADFDYAHEKVIMGLKREETISESEKRKTAYHEAGHTILGWFSTLKSHVHKVTIIPRGRSLGATYFMPDEEQVNINESQIRAMLVRYLGGRAAERIVYEESSAGAEEDLKQATQLARRMVIHWGMSEKLGPVAFRAMESNPFLGREMSSEYREYSESTAKIIDEEVFRFLREADQTAHSTLHEKRELLEKLCDALVEQEELDQDQLTEILGPAPTR